MILRFIREGAELTDKQKKTAEYNLSQTEIGHELRTLGSNYKTKRYKDNVGKIMEGKIYAHKNYIYECVPKELVDNALVVLNDVAPDFEWNCFRYDPKSGDIAFQEAPDFDTAREPVVGRSITITRDGRALNIGRYFPQIWHHKWQWVKNDYNGFDVEDSWEWSKKWLSELPVPANGSNEANWKKQLAQYGIED